MCLYHKHLQSHECFGSNENRKFVIYQMFIILYFFLANYAMESAAFRVIRVAAWIFSSATNLISCTMALINLYVIFVIEANFKMVSKNFILFYSILFHFIPFDSILFYIISCFSQNTNFFCCYCYYCSCYFYAFIFLFIFE